MKTLKIDGMSCGHCERRVKNALEEIDGVQVLSVSADQNIATVETDVEDAVLMAAVEEAGYTVTAIE
ncbi:heavy-metal-associated domain-containing protein [Acidaminobacter hydrogenoformans]|uniref:Copper chaperone n=1 Tax=Acidaminobacter hydrogenoformans DSM 2784 TaxID=1120920 RepID=A0A1G5RW68_9FIRM|nr:heavy-metal-associated domain-containing protein [Acidaminobacter hydrogenoformans]SCZ78293.1 copper chaperone [Acidaminobacter hydrogenoformans DSM 2784]